MANFLINYNGKIYANRRFVEEMISYKVINKKLFQFNTITVLDQVLLEVADDIKEVVFARKPCLQNLNEQLNLIQAVSPEQIEVAKKNMELGFPNSCVMTLPKSLMPSTYKLGGLEFYKYSEYKKQYAYSSKIMTKVAMVKVCGCLYAALDSVKLGIDKPIVITKEL